ncbi:MAG TPA: hypothetical protein VGH99_24510 [Pseudonocardia sp.]|jgi:hypothetical protein
MAEQNPPRIRRTTTVSSVRLLRLDPWRPVPDGRAEEMLGSLSAILSDFAPAPARALVPAQRPTPEAVEWLR